MSAEQYNSATERSSQDQSEWGHSLVSHQHHHPYFLQQNLGQVQDVYSHPGPLEATTAQSKAAKSAYGNVSTTIDECTIQSPSSVNVGQGAIPSPHISMLGLPATSKNSADIVQRLQQRRDREEHIHPSKAWSGHSTQLKCTKRSASKRSSNLCTSSLTVRPVGTKDRHSKVRTAKGLRDRRVRLSAPTAIQFFDVQDRLGYDQPSKAVDWLIKKARAAIDELAPAVDEATAGGEISSDRPVQERRLSRQHDPNSSSARIGDEEQSLAAITGARAESRAKARERARERAKEKITTPGPPANASVETSRNASTPRATAPPFSSPFTTSVASLQLLPEYPLLPSQFGQQLDEELHRPSDLSSMLTSPSIAVALPSTSHLFPFASAFFSSNSAAQSFLISGDGPHLQYSTPPAYNNITTTINTAPSSPRGTLQSIFSNPATSSTHAPVPSPVMPMQAHSYGTTHSSFVKDPCMHHDPHAPFRQSSAELKSHSLQHSHIPMRIRGMELGSHVEETRIASSMQADYN